MPSQLADVTDANFQRDVLNADQPVLVDFWAVWSGPCRSLAQYLELIAIEFGDRLQVVRMDVDANTQTAKDYCVRNTPALLLFHHGKLVDQLVGSPGSRANLMNFVRRNLEAQTPPPVAGHEVATVGVAALPS